MKDKLVYQERLEILRKLPPDWDSYGGLPPTAEAIKTAEEFLTVIGIPFIAPLPNGGLTFEWNLPSGETVLVDILPSGSIDLE